MNPFGVEPFAFLAFAGVLIGMALITGAGFVQTARLFRKTREEPRPPPAVFLFNSGILAEANPAGFLLLGPGSRDIPDWSDLLAALSDSFPDLPLSQPSDKRHAPVFLNSANRSPNKQLRLDQWGETVRVVVQHAPEEPNPADGASSDTVLNDAPMPVWQTDPDGQLVWANRSYQELAKLLEPAESRLFPRTSGKEQGERVGLTDHKKEKTRWFDIFSRDSGDLTTHYAIDAEALVLAEIAQRNFVQTLTKTFAHLSIGLAIFNRSRQLALFNPALIDLTALPAEFLSAKPSLDTFFDHLRENRVMPEPKDYVSWRARLTELVVAASDGRYSETWTLPSGLTYRVSGRPHPDGAIAFLFEDISAEISLTRRFRAELELNQSLLDNLDDAIAVFSQSGVLTLGNRQFHTLWSDQPEEALSSLSIETLSRRWQKGGKDSSVWQKVRESIGPGSGRNSWSDIVSMEEGEDVILKVDPLNSGATMVRFRKSVGMPSNQSERNQVPASKAACGAE